VHARVVQQEEMCSDVVVAASHSIGAVVVDIEENAHTRLD
jgi:hypothetical protein